MLLAILLLSLNAKACSNFIAESEIPNAINLAPNAGAKLCGGNDACVCFDGVNFAVVDWDGTNRVFVPNSTKKAAFDAQLAADQAAKVQDRTDRAAIIVKLQSGTATVADIGKFLRILLKSSGN